MRLGLFGLVRGNCPFILKIRSHWPSTRLVSVVDDPAKAAVIFLFELFIGEAEHRFGQLVEEQLRLIGILAGRIFPHMAIQFFVIFSDLIDVVFELNQPQQLIVVRRARPFGDS